MTVKAPRRTISTGLALWMAYAVFATPFLARGDGGTLRVSNVPMGAYRISVYTDPTPVPPDTIDVSVLATFERGRGVARGLEILVVAHPLDGPGPDITHPATRDQADDPRFYAAKFALGAVGPWDIAVQVEGPEGEGQVSFSIDVREPGLLGNPWLILTVAFLPIALVGIWFRRTSGRARSDGASPG